jgi:hypothetical protein
MWNTNHKNSGVDLWISCKVYFESRNISNDEEENVHIKQSVHRKGVIILNVCKFNKKVLKYTKQTVKTKTEQFYYRHFTDISFKVLSVKKIIRIEIWVLPIDNRFI